MKGLKSILFLSVAFVFAISCRKNRTCECVTTQTSNGAQTITLSEFHSTKSNAEKLCDELDKNEGDFSTECEIK